MPSHSSEFSNDNDQSSQGISGAKRLVADLEASIIAEDWDYASECADTLADDALLFRKATPPLLNMFCSEDPELQIQAGKLLFQRPHWIDVGDLNDLVIPCVVDRAVEGATAPVFEHSLYGLSMVARAIEDRHIESIFRIVKEVFYEQEGGAARLGNATLLAFGERVPDDQRSAVLQCVRHILREMQREIASGVDSEGVTNPTDFDSLAISALSELRPFLADYSIRRSHRDLARDIVLTARRFVDTYAEYAEAGNHSSAYAELLLLVMYPTLDPDTHIPTRQAIGAIADSMREDSPRFSRILLKSIDEEEKAEDIPNIPDENLVDANTFRDLQLVSDLSRMSRMFREDQVVSAHIVNENSSEGGIEGYLRQLAYRVKQRTVAMQVQHAQAALNDSSL